jgi:hypothetical protein
VALLGATTHQALAAATSGARARPAAAIRIRAGDPAVYSRLIVALFIATTVLGAVLYPSYRLIVQPVLKSLDLRTANGAFEVKEHLSALGLLMLPAYWAAWSATAVPRYVSIRHPLLWILTAIVWWNFVVGQLLNNVRGLYL